VRSDTAESDQTATYLDAHRTNEVEVVLLTPEARPLAVFGPVDAERIGTTLGDFLRARDLGRCPTS
jgi:hypothetical protein